MVHITINERSISFSEFYEIYYKQIYNFIYRYALNEETAVDLVANTFVKALSSIKKKNRPVNKAWLYKIALNEFYTYYNKYKTKQIISLEDLNEDSQYKLLEDTTGRIEDLLILRKALKKLKPTDQLIVHYFYFDNMSHEEISKELNINEGAIRTRLHRTLKKIKSFFT